jgi:hypothetical protein
MTQEELIEFMSFKQKTIKPLAVFPVNGSFILGVYKGSLSQYDLLIKYRQKNNEKWSRIRTPKHIHWAVDILIKMNLEKEKTKDFLNVLIDVWENIKPIKNEDDRKRFLKIDNLLEINQERFNDYKELSKHGEYSINFLILLAKLLMIQEKTNLETAFMFKNLLNALRDGSDIFKIVSTATHNGR